jgi:hypothetical protein
MWSLAIAVEVAMMILIDERMYYIQNPKTRDSHSIYIVGRMAVVFESWRGDACGELSGFPSPETKL